MEEKESDSKNQESITGKVKEIERPRNRKKRIERERGINWGEERCKRISWHGIVLGIGFSAKHNFSQFLF